MIIGIVALKTHLKLLLAFYGLPYHTANNITYGTVFGFCDLVNLLVEFFRQPQADILL